MFDVDGIGCFDERKWNENGNGRKRGNRERREKEWEMEGEKISGGGVRWVFFGLTF